MLEEKKQIAGGEITLRAQYIGNDLLLICAGGDKPHIGAVSLAVPHIASDLQSASVSTITAPTHRDDLISALLSRMFSRELQTVVTVSCGIHYDVFSPAMIVEVQEGVKELARHLLAKLKADPRGDRHFLHKA